MVKRKILERDCTLFIEWETGQHDHEVPGNRRRVNASQDKQKQESLIEWAENEQKRRDYEAFYKEATPYIGTDVRDYSYEKAEVLANHFYKFRKGNQRFFDLETNRLTTSAVDIGRIFEGVIKYAGKVLG